MNSYCIKELQRDIELQLAAVKDESERERLRAETQLGIFVVHNKSVQFSLSAIFGMFGVRTNNQAKGESRRTRRKRQILLCGRYPRRLARIPMGMRWRYRGTR